LSGLILPPPLVPAEVDLRNFAFMPVEVARLRQSKQWLIAKRRPELGFYAFNLWAASWHQRPAASIEDDDDVLADFALCPPDEWASVRHEVLRGWVKCSDGRLYHPVVAEKALEAWKKKLAQRNRTEAASAARKSKHLAQRDDDVTISSRQRDDDVTATKGEREREGKRRDTSINRESESLNAARATNLLDREASVSAKSEPSVATNGGKNRYERGSVADHEPQTSGTAGISSDPPRCGVSAKWQPSEAAVMWAILQKWSRSQLAAQVEAFRAYSVGHGKSYADLDEAFKSWLIRSKQFGRSTGTEQPKGVEFYVP